jgi:hypothetical protein
MSIIAVLIGGIFGTLTALIALFGIGVDWSTAATVYFTTATLIALPIIGFGSVNRYKNNTGPSMTDWERELHDYQPGTLIPAPITGGGQDGVSNKKAA